MKITIITAFPDYFEVFFSTSIIGRAVEKGLLEAEVIDLRDYAKGHYRQIDDYAYGGGGMVLMAQPLKEAIENSSRNNSRLVVSPGPQGAMLTQETVETLSRQDHIVIICGHYEGIDERILQKYVDLEISLGDFVVTGGEIPAMAIVDAVARQIPGVVGKKEAVIEDSYYRGFLDHPHFTRPSEWDNEKVPEVLLSGNDKEVLRWRREEARSRTLSRRPDLIGRANILPYIGAGAYLVLTDIPKDKPDGAVEKSWTLDILKNIVHTCSCYGLERVLYVNPLSDERSRVKGEIAGFQDVPSLKVVPSLEASIKWIEKREKYHPFTVSVSDELEKGSIHWLDIKRRILEMGRPPVFVKSLNPEVAEKDYGNIDASLQPVRGTASKSDCSLPLSSNIAVILDRFFGFR